jgi:hypothetical protein
MMNKFSIILSESHIVFVVNCMDPQFFRQDFKTYDQDVHGG